MKDEKLIKLAERAARGDKKAFSQLCEQKARNILYVTTRMMKNVQDGEDAAQEVLLYMQKHIRELRHPEAFNVWMYRIINGVCMNMLKKKGREKAVDAVGRENGQPPDIETVEEDREEFLPYDFVEAKEKRASLFKALDVLPERYRLCIYLYYFEQLSYEEIAEDLGIKKTDVDNALRRGKKVLRQQLEKNPEMKKFLTKGYAVMPLPVMTLAMQRDARELISDDAVQRLLANTTATGGVVLFLQQHLAKILVGTAALGGAAALGLALYGADQKKEEPAEIQNEAMASVGNSQEPEGLEEITEAVLETWVAETVETEGEIQQIIRTLEDMIGSQEADILRAYVNSRTVDREEVIAFLFAIGMEVYEGVWNPFGQWEYTLFVLEKQDKLLMAILRHDMEQEESSLVYRFTDIGERMPANIEIKIWYDRW